MPESKRFFKDVSDNSTEELDFVIPNNQTIHIGVCYGESGNSPETSVAIIWDASGVNDLIYVTHEHGIDTYVNKKFTGDGVKKITIKLVNNSNSSVMLGAGWTE